MLFANDGIRDDLSKSSTILQVALSILDFECNKFHSQPEIFDVENNIATIDVEGLDTLQIMDACIAVNRQFQRVDDKPTCYHLDTDDTIVVCEALPLDQYKNLA